MKQKTVYLNGTPIGSARTWQEVAELVTGVLHRDITMRDVVRRGSEGPDGFYVQMQG